MTLFQLLVKAYAKLGQLTISKATGGSTTTVVDSLLVSLNKDDAFKNSAMFITRDAGGASAAPEGEFSVCTTYADGTGTFTVSPAFTAAPASGDSYGYALALFPLYTMIELANGALQSIGDIPLVDSSTTTVAAQRQYSVPVALKRQRPIRVEVNLSDTSNDTNRVMIPDWDWYPATPGSTGLIQLHRQPPSGQTLYMVYMGVHPAVNAASDKIAEVIDPELATLGLALGAAQWYNRLLQGSEDFWLQTEDKIQRDYENRLVTHAPYTPPEEPRLFIPGDQQDVRYSRVTGDEIA